MEKSAVQQQEKHDDDEGATVTDEAFVTLATSDTYGLGALVVGASLRGVKTRRKTVCMITDTVSDLFRSYLRQTFDEVCLVDPIDSKDETNLELLERRDLGITFTKLQCWKLTSYKKCVFLDADTLVLQNCDELFEREEFSAAPDPGWPDCFNSGVFVFSPSKETYSRLVQHAKDVGSFDGGDQGLLNTFFSDWATKDISKHLPFLYNVVAQSFYSYLPAFRKFGHGSKICHFIGSVKPWHHTYDEASESPISEEGTGFNANFLSRWWTLFRSRVLPLMNQTSMESVMPQLSGLTITTLKPSHSDAYTQLSDSEHQSAWEQGVIDYRGMDSFTNIQKHLDAKLAAVPPPQPDVRPKTPSSSAAKNIVVVSSDTKMPKKSALKKPHHE